VPRRGSWFYLRREAFVVWIARSRGLSQGKPGWLQAPTKFELIVDLEIAKALGLAVPFSLPGRADKRCAMSEFGGEAANIYSG
jgi:hypothetical protein